jgi:hypothetical protein
MGVVSTTVSVSVDDEMLALTPFTIPELAKNVGFSGKWYGIDFVSCAREELAILESSNAEGSGVRGSVLNSWTTSE